MSVEAMAWVLRHSPLKGQEKLVLLGVANHADPRGLNAWPSVETLAAYANASERTVQRILAKLEAGGHIVVHRRQGGPDGLRSDRRPNLYELVILPEDHPDGVTDVVTPSGPHEVTDPTPRGDKTAPRGDKRPSRGDTQAVTQTSLEPSSEPSFSSRPDVEQICTLLADLIEGNGSKRPTITKAWRTEARRLIDLDKPPHGVDGIEQVMRWCQADDFWRSVVLSMPKFREKYSALRLKALAEHRKATRSTTTERINQVDAAYAELQRRGGFPALDQANTLRQIGPS